MHDRNRFQLGFLLPRHRPVERKRFDQRARGLN